ncbi:MAG: 3-phosphoshikimate 1-carboxyvinyltransferase, partial [Bacteroidetes bacterium]|nr:3-phosphoshikimate 1-carboxyvinyltransferase [Bacteroidota bacterium]
MNQTIPQPARSEGAVALPADKSIAHRAALLAALSDGPSKITNFPDAADPRSTLVCLRQLGVEIDEEERGILMVEGVGLEGLQAPKDP